MVRKEKDDALLEFGLRFERWVKRNRVLLGVIGAAIALLIAGLTGHGIYDDMRLKAANNAYETLLKDPADIGALATLQAKSPELYDLFLLGAAADANDSAALEQLSQKESVAADLAAYQLAALSSDGAALNKYAMRETKRQNSLKDFAALQEAYLLLKQGEWQSARAKLSHIATSSDLGNFASALEHYGADKK
ncbi:MAG: hypothetical protein LBC09_04530 [Helicobacteraceae bacterium]|jgi:hypothetical protein|nr:hypothetical protein [Helicobacteraceae bacterium]